MVMPPGIPDGDPPAPGLAGNRGVLIFCPRSLERISILKRLWRVTVRPLSFIILVSLEYTGSTGFGLILEGLESEIFDFTMVWERFWKA